MALGGGTFTAKNKVMPGAYINFVSAASASSALSDRGTVAMPLELDWGIDGEIFEVTSGEFISNSTEIFGYDYTHPKMAGLRDLFLNARTFYAYKLTSGGKKAKNTYAEALYTGVRGNDIKIVIGTNVDDETKFDVTTTLGTAVVDTQTVSTADELKPNKFVKFLAAAELAATAATPLSGGENGVVNGEAHQAFLDKLGVYSFNTLGVAVEDKSIKGMYAAFAKRMRDEVGVKFQVVLHDYAADHLGIINVKNEVKVPENSSWGKVALVYWVTGAAAGCAVNSSIQNRIYNGEFDVDTEFTQTELTKSIEAGEFVLHKAGGDIRVLKDINSKVTVSDSEGEIFKENQTVRVMDQIANDIAVLFSIKYLGAIPNDAAGRVSLWADIVEHHRQLEQIRAIENFNEEDVTVEQGGGKKSVVVTDAVTVVNAMDKLYMTVTVA